MKKTISVFLCCFILLLCLYIPSSATEEKTILYLNYGNIIIGENEISGYDQSGKKVTQANPMGYIITQKNPASVLDKGVKINSANCEIEIRNLNISRFNEYDSAFAVQKTSNVTVTISGENHLVSGSSRAGLEVGIDSSVTINGDGILYVQSSLQAGIGGGNGQPNGTLIIDSGTIYATGGIDGYSAGIGGGSSGHGGNITINGGYICATGGMYAAGIGGGFMSGGGNITINGGVVTATAGNNGAGIGSGYICSGTTNIVINGGSVKAVGGSDSDNIGNGARAKTEFSGVYNSEGKKVSLVNYTLSDFSEIYINGIDSLPIDSLHPEDDSLYLYADDTEKIITSYMQDGSVRFFLFSNAGVEEVFPYAEDCERFCDRLIMSKDSEISVSEGFSVENQSDLMYGSVRTDSFKNSLRGDLNFDGELNGMDAVICNCVLNSMLSDSLMIKLADTNGDGITDSDDVLMLTQCGLGVNDNAE